MEPDAPQELEKARQNWLDQTRVRGDRDRDTSGFDATART
jgi:hypothetical protein